MLRSSRSRRLPLLAIVTAALLAAANAPSASAAGQRYASPDGWGTLCSEATPCSLGWAIQGSLSIGDEVILKPGDYTLTATLVDAHQLTIHGIDGQPRPRIYFSGAAQSGMRLTHGSTLRWAEVDQAPGRDSSALVLSNSAWADQVIVRASGAEATVYAQNAAIRNSIVVANGTGGWAVETSSSASTSSLSLHHVTAIATGNGGFGIQAQAFFPTGKSTVTATNVIARGGPAGASLRTWTDSSGAQAIISVDHSNFGPGSNVGSYSAFDYGSGNQLTLPTFADAAAGDYHQAPGSVTVGAGVEDVFAGPSDVDGQPRAIGTTDIGADELASAPAVVTGSASAVTARSAALSGTTDPQGIATAYHFEYGPTAAYGASTGTAGAGSGSGPVAVGANVTGLTPGATYHFRLVASSAGGTTVGQDQTFTTAGTATAGTTSTGSSSTGQTAAFAGVKLVSTKLRFSRRTVTVTLSCPAGTVGGCSGRTRLSARGVRLGKASFSIAPGRQARVKVRVTRAGRRMLGRVHKLAAKDTNAAQDRAGQSKTSVARVTIRRAR